MLENVAPRPGGAARIRVPRVEGPAGPAGARDRSGWPPAGPVRKWDGLVLTVSGKINRRGGAEPHAWEWTVVMGSGPADGGPPAEDGCRRVRGCIGRGRRGGGADSENRVVRQPGPHRGAAEPRRPLVVVYGAAGRRPQRVGGAGGRAGRRRAGDEGPRPGHLRVFVDAGAGSPPVRAGPGRRRKLARVQRGRGHRPSDGPDAV